MYIKIYELEKWTHKLISTYLEEQIIRANSLNFYLETESEKEIKV